MIESLGRQAKQALLGSCGSGYLWIYIVVYTAIMLYIKHWRYGYCFDPDNAIGEQLGFGAFYDYFARKQMPREILASEILNLPNAIYILALILVAIGAFFVRGKRLFSVLANSAFILVFLVLSTQAHYVSAAHSCRLALVHENIIRYYEERYTAYVIDQNTNLKKDIHFVELENADAGARLIHFRFPDWTEGGPGHNACGLYLLMDPKHFVAAHGGPPTGWVPGSEMPAWPSFANPSSRLGNAPFPDDERLFFWGPPVFNVRATEVEGTQIYTMIACDREVAPMGGESPKLR